MFETFDHTADLGMRVAADTEARLFEEAARGLLSLLVENPEAVSPQQEATIDIRGTETDYLFFDWLSELLFRFETQKFLACQWSIARTAEGIRAVVRGETVDASRHRLAHEVKAITYHDLIVRQTDGGWEAEFIVDI